MLVPSLDAFPVIRMANSDDRTRPLFIVQMRPLASTDHSRGHLSVLTVLTSAPDPGESPYTAQFNLMKSTPNTYYTIVIVNKSTDTIVGVGCVFMERKFLRNLGLVGHIEDIAVDKKVQGAKLGLRIIQALTGISEGRGAYKTILNCSTENIRTFLVCLYFIIYLFLLRHIFMSFSVLSEVWIRGEGARNGEICSWYQPCFQTLKQLELYYPLRSFCILRTERRQSTSLIRRGTV